MTGYCWRPGPSRCVFPSLGPTSPMSCTLRSLADCHAIIEYAKACAAWSSLGQVSSASRSLPHCAHVVEFHVVAPEKRPMERIRGRRWAISLQPGRGDRRSLHLYDTATAIDGKRVKLKGGDTLEADLVVVVYSVFGRASSLPRKQVSNSDRGIVVDQYLETSAPGIYAAGDIARWPDPHSGENIRVEHWVVAERQGQAVALNMLGDTARRSPPRRFLEGCTTTSRSTMSVTPKSGTKSRLTVTSRAGTVF